MAAEIGNTVVEQPRAVEYSRAVHVALAECADERRITLVPGSVRIDETVHHSLQARPHAPPLWSRDRANCPDLDLRALQSTMGKLST